MTKLLRLEFFGGPLDGAIRPVPEGCNMMPLASGASIHLYTRDEVFDGYRMRQIMRHHQIKQAWSHE